MIHRDSANRLMLERHRAALLVIDFQERLAEVMPKEARAQAEHNICVLIECAQRFNLPVVVSRQYPKGLGQTVERIEQALAGLEDVHCFDKLDFSVCDAADFPMARDALGEERDQWIVAGMETHICVYQTVRELCQMGEIVHVPCDAVVSRYKRNFKVGLDLIERAGGIVTSTEAVMFDLLGRAGTDDFKALTRLIK